MVKLSDVAKKAKVSLTTASFVLNDRAEEMRIGAYTVHRVIKAADKLKYAGNYHARMLLHGRAHTLGLIMPPTHNHMMFMHMYEGLLTESRHHEFDILQISESGGETAIQRGMRCIREGRIEGLISFNQPTKSIARTIINDQLPVCFICLNKPALCAHVIVNPLPGVREAVRHLVALGHRDVLYILRKQANGEMATPDRYDAAMDEAGLHRLTLHAATLPPPPAAISNADDFISYYYEELFKHLPNPIRETAVLCYNDKMAAALYMIFQHRGIRVPDDISVIGYDDTLASHLMPPLTTIRQPFHAMGAEAVREVIAQFENKDNGRNPETIVLPSELIVRESTAPMSGDRFQVSGFSPSSERCSD